MLPAIDPNGIFTLDEVVGILQRGGAHLMDFAYRSFMQDGRGAVVWMFNDGRLDKLAYARRDAFEGSGFEDTLFPRIDQYMPARQCVVVVLWRTHEGGRQSIMSRNFTVIPKDDAWA